MRIPQSFRESSRILENPLQRIVREFRKIPKKVFEQFSFILLKISWDTNKSTNCHESYILFNKKTMTWSFQNLENL